VLEVPTVLALRATFSSSTVSTISNSTLQHL
jgi:hypothetical protein